MAEAAIVFGADDAYFYRCRQCQALISILDERARMRTGKACLCGSANYNPTDLKWWEWIRPKVLRVIVVKLLGGFDDTKSELYG